ncbi:AGE family epimerase/isomerase [Actinomyces ruminicola]|uniref:Sulfoquinovose isomerase n=1 Tax=Actinomyces ruminicola TaxID=332524 RepID=A0A1G9WXX9_9ACTO|nr:AGE family epimerase/isomerase [Actinomyces ruminicola]SDM89026.1 sulfoquinovose isomerase [Actinomyces ruminicola]
MPSSPSRTHETGTLITDLDHCRWLVQHRNRLLDFYQPEVWADGMGFAYLDDAGHPLRDSGAQLWIGARMTHCFAVAHLLGRPGAAEFAKKGVDFYLSGPGRDPEYDGWYATVGGTQPSERKELYGQAHIVLAAASAAQAGIDGAEALLTQALAVIDRHYWLEDVGRCVEAFDRSFTDLDLYRGQNANMHLTEAYLAAFEATGDRTLLLRAGRIAHNTVGAAAEPKAGSWRVCEHFSPDWEPLPDYNADQPHHPFRPYGSQPGHWLEWAKLLMQIRGVGLSEDWMLPAARNLVDGAMQDGWQPSGGFVYTVDWDGTPVVKERFWWPVAEAIGATRLLSLATGEGRYADLYAQLWAYTQAHLIDPGNGTWFPEVDEHNRHVVVTWPGRPDLYHAFQATIYAFLPLDAGIALWARSVSEDGERP